ncbi:flagellar assembly protein FliW [Bacillus sp. SCS-153A]|uniref:flagellar assembly protein FliW n=1 Tax=Rossellomorea sedimentorum TaxID=3115294 RepID=UPI0039059CE0
MEISTKYHGKIDIKLEETLIFDGGIPGFLKEKRFVLLPLPDNQFFHILQSVETQHLAFVVTDPFIFFKDYDFTIDENTVEFLGNPVEKDIKVLTILTVKEPMSETTANLQAPVIINLSNKKAKQVILNNTDYRTRHQIFSKTEELQKG